MPAAHILTFAQSFRGGGVERAMLRLAGGWVAAGRRVTLAIGDPAGPLARELPPGVETIVTGSDGYAALLAALPRVVRRSAPDVIFCSGSHYTGVAAFARLRLGRRCPPIVAKISNALARPDHGLALATGNRAWLRLQPRLIDRFVAMTAATAAEAQAAMRLPPDRIAVIANPPAMPILGDTPMAIPSGRFLIGVGRLAPQKRWDRLIDALPLVGDPSIPLVILGEGDSRAALEARIAALGLAGRVTLPGHAADPLPVIARAAALILTSDFEGAPGVLREALGVGTPVITTESSVAVREIVTAPTLGSIVPMDDPAALAAAIDRWLAPDRPRPAPVPPPGADSAAAYLALFDRLA